MSRKSKSFLTAVATALIIWAVGTFLLPRESVSYSLRDNTLTTQHMSSRALHTETDYAYSVALSEIVGYDLVEVDGSAVLLEGADTSRCRYGLLQDPVYGECQACLYRKPNCAVLIQTEAGKRYLLSFEDDDNTKGFYEGLKKLMEEF